MGLSEYVGALEGSMLPGTDWDGSLSGSLVHQGTFQEGELQQLLRDWPGDRMASDGEQGSKGRRTGTDDAVPPVITLPGERAKVAKRRAVGLEFGTGRVVRAWLMLGLRRELNGHPRADTKRQTLTMPVVWMGIVRPSSEGCSWMSDRMSSPCSPSGKSSSCLTLLAALLLVRGVRRPAELALSSSGGASSIP